jgi:DUF4097 and DUF4098 domain-containing protein YvlB
MKKDKFQKAFVVFLSYFAVAAMGCSTNGCEPKEKYERVVKLTDAMPAGGSFEAQTHNGYINVTGADVAQCDLTATIAARADTVENAQKLAEAVEIKLINSGSRLTAKIEKPELAPDERISVDLDVTVPNKTSVDLTSHNGPLNIENLIGQVSSTTHNGTITCKKVTGNTQIQTHNGSIVCEEVSGDIKLQTHNGNATASYSAAAPPVCNASLITHNGSVSLTTPPNLSAKVEVSTHNGTIDTALPMTVTGNITKRNLTGTIGKGEGQLYLKTHNGSISVK